MDEETLLNRALLKLADRIVVESDGEFHPVRLRNIVDTMGGREAVRFLINNPPSEGFLRLRAIDRIDLTVEALILDNPDFWPLFSEEELNVCRLRMEKF